MMATPATAGVPATDEGGGERGQAKSRTRRIMDAMPSSKQAMGAGGSSTYQVCVALKRKLLLPERCGMYFFEFNQQVA